MERPLKKAMQACCGGRKPRADSLRNRERLLEAAKAVFSVGGPEASLEAVARRAEVGIGTLYRHFPTRDALFEAVYRRDIDQAAELAERLAAELPPMQALRDWLRACVSVVATKKGMITSLAIVVEADMFSYSADRLGKAVALLQDRAVAAGEIRDDIGAEDILRMLVSLCFMQDQPGWQDQTLRLLDVFLDGLRTGR